MRMSYFCHALLVTLAATCLFTDDAFARGAGSGGSQSGQGTPVALTADESSSLLFMREEEKLARDVYLVMSDIWGTPIFSNIAASEQRHMDAILALLDKYGLPDPALAKGVFANAELQELYDHLIADGSLSELNALLVGALIEEVDIEDLQVAIEETTHADIARVYGNLVRGSESHLRAFTAQVISWTGEPYVAQYLPQEVVDAILAEGSRRGRGRR